MAEQRTVQSSLDPGTVPLDFLLLPSIALGDQFEVGSSHNLFILTGV